MKDIIIVEDGRQERERLQKLFGDHGYSVVACESVSDAERALSEDSFRLAVLDIGLGDKSGSHLFNSMKKGTSAPYVIVFTGNPSVHLKQRFLEGGAVDYIVKASSQAQNENLLTRVREIIGEPQAGAASEGIDLELFLGKYINEASRSLFLDVDNTFPPCTSCSGKKYLVTFSHQTQVPPDLSGKVVCASCGKAMDPEVG